VIFLYGLLAGTVQASAGENSGSIFKGGSIFGQGLGFSGGAKKFLPADQAFMFTADVLDGQDITAHWQIADGYYLYRSKFSFQFKGAEGASIGAPVFPAGKFKQDEYFGRMEVYKHAVNIALPLKRNTTGRLPVVLEVRYQGCADAGFCYPPQKKRIDLVLPATGGAGAALRPTAATPLADMPEQDRIAHSLASQSTWLSLLGFFGFGLLLAFTPCVFPMLPILSSIIVGQRQQVSTRRAFMLSASYVLAMALTYTLAGIAAALFGSNLQIMFQNPWVLASFSAVFVVLALSMFGLFQLQLPTALQSRFSALSRRREGSSTYSAAMMGFFSALIVGPCVAPPLAGILIYIGISGDAWRGGLSLFFLSLGMGLPLLVFGTSAGKLLPRAGPWMDVIKNSFGVMLLAVAIWLLERIIPAELTLLLWAALLIMVAVYLGAFDRLEGVVTGWRRFWKGAGAMVFIYGVVLIVGAAGGGVDVLHPLQGLRLAGTQMSTGAKARQPVQVFRPVKGTDGLMQAVQAAAANARPVMVDFYADWCIDCKRMERRTFTDPAVRQSLQQMSLLQADVTANDADDKRLLKQYGLYGPPAILFFDRQGRELKQYRLVGFLDPADFNRHVQAALAAML